MPYSGSEGNTFGHDAATLSPFEKSASVAVQGVLPEPVLPSSSLHILEETNIFIEVYADSETATPEEIELRKCIEEFKECYRYFATKHDLVLLEDDTLRNAFQSTNLERDLRVSAKAFECEIAKVHEIKHEETQISQTKWTGRCFTFLKNLYPLARFSLGVTTAIAEVVCPRICRD